MKFTFKKSKATESSWISQPDWETVCTNRNIAIQQHPYKEFVGLAYNKENQVVQITKNTMNSLYIFYVTLLENSQQQKVSLNPQSFMSVKSFQKYTKNDVSISDIELIDLYVRKEGIGERGLLLEALIQTLLLEHAWYHIHGNFNQISLHGQVSLNCFTKYGFQVINNDLFLSNIP